VDVLRELVDEEYGFG